MANKAEVMARLTLGSALMVAAVMVFLGTLTPTILGPFLAIESAVPPNQFEVRSMFQLPTAGPLLFRMGKLEVIYPAVMRENETLPVEVTYSVTWNPLELPDPLGRDRG